MGTVNFYNKKKKFGAILTTKNELVVFHGKDLNNLKLGQGDSVAFILKEGQVEGSLTAHNIKLIDKQEK